jgi:hypothetical protein
MSKLKWVLVRSNLGTLYVLPRPDWDKYQAQAKHMGASGTELVAESEDYEELRRFKELAREET